MTERGMLEAIRDALAFEMERDDRVMVLGQDVGSLGGVFRATEGLQARFGSDRVRDVPLAESSIVGASIGLAASGLVPVAEIQFFGFAHLAYHQIAHQLARLRYRSQGRLTCGVTIRCPFGGRDHALELHSDAAESLYAQVPGLKVAAPATASDAKGMLLSAIRDPDPVLFIEPLRGYRLTRDDVPDGDHTVSLGRARTRAKDPTSRSSPGPGWSPWPSGCSKRSQPKASAPSWSTCARSSWTPKPSWRR